MQMSLSSPSVASLAWVALVVLVCVALVGCTDTPLSGKIELDLAAADERGLIGPPDGLRAISYEFCIPNDPVSLEEVRSIDGNVQIQGESPGRIGCADGEVLCVSHTAQPDYRHVLGALAGLGYIDRIIEAHFE